MGRQIGHTDWDLTVGTRSKRPESRARILGPENGHQFSTPDRPQVPAPSAYTHPIQQYLSIQGIAHLCRKVLNDCQFVVFIRGGSAARAQIMRQLSMYVA